MAVPPVLSDLLTPRTLPTGADEAGGPPLQSSTRSRTTSRYLSAESMALVLTEPADPAVNTETVERLAA
jgi:hypothetical protein